MLKFIAFLLLIIAMFYVLRFLVGVVMFTVPALILIVCVAGAVWLAYKAIYK